jgi:hypothetical protein
VGGCSGGSFLGVDGSFFEKAVKEDAVELGFEIGDIFLDATGQTRDKVSGHLLCLKKIAIEGSVLVNMVPREDLEEDVNNGL